LTLGSEAGGGAQASMRHLTNIFRRVYRIFAHAWFQHREVFWQVEGHDGLYVFFKAVCDVYHLIPDDGYTIPTEAEGEEPANATEDDQLLGRRVTILRKENEVSDEATTGGSDPEHATLSTGATTRRHKHSPSTGATVATIIEAAEDDETNRRAHDPEEHSVLELPKLAADAEDEDLKTPIPEMGSSNEASLKPGLATATQFDAEQTKTETASSSDPSIMTTASPEDEANDKSEVSDTPQATNPFETAFEGASEDIVTASEPKPATVDERSVETISRGSDPGSAEPPPMETETEVTTDPDKAS
jgi:hypothetical protein